MARNSPKARRRQVCPSCSASIEFLPQKDDLGTCPRCGEWLMQHGRWNKRLERLDREPGTDFDESTDWERSLIDEIE